MRKVGTFHGVQLYTFDRVRLDSLEAVARYKAEYEARWSSPLRSLLISTDEGDAILSDAKRVLGGQ